MASQTPWQLDSIASGDTPFSFSRLSSRAPHSHLRFELLKNSAGEVLPFLITERHHFTPSNEDPQFANLLIRIEGAEYKSRAYLRKGGMRLSLLKEIGEPIILALKEGKQVELLLDGFQGTLLPDEFSPLFSQFLEGATEPFQFMKGI